MKVLAIETSGKAGEFAVVDEDRVLSESGIDVAGRLVEKGVGEVADAIARAGMSLDDLDAVAVSIGPGSFTGLRVGLAIAKGLCFRREIALVGVPTLDAMAEALRGRAGFTAPVIDARRGEIYFSIYSSDGDAVKRLAGYLALPPETAVRRIRRECGDAPVLLAGDALAAYGDFLVSGLGAGSEPAPEEAWRPRAAVIGRLGLAMLAEGNVLDPATAEPIYIRPSEAERRAGRS
jgi:tRNA threonylcarbamoyladenosine biosynthesis protein TsaB